MYRFIWNGQIITRSPAKKALGSISNKVDNLKYSMCLPLTIEPILVLCTSVYFKKQYENNILYQIFNIYL